MDYRIVKKHIKYNIDFFDKLDTDVVVYTTENLSSAIDSNLISWSRGNYYITKIWCLKELNRTSDAVIWRIRNMSAIWRIKKQIESFLVNNVYYWFAFRNTKIVSYEGFLNDYMLNKLNNKQREIFLNKTISFEYLKRLQARHSYASSARVEIRKGVNPFLEKEYKKYKANYSLSKGEKMELYKWRLSCGGNKNIYMIMKFLMKYDCKIYFNKYTDSYFIKKGLKQVIISPNLLKGRHRFTYVGNVEEDNIQCNLSHKEITFPKKILKYVGPILKISPAIVDLENDQFDDYINEILNRTK